MARMAVLLDFEARPLAMPEVEEDRAVCADRSECLSDSMLLLYTGQNGRRNV